MWSFGVIVLVAVVTAAAAELLLLLRAMLNLVDRRARTRRVAVEHGVSWDQARSMTHPVLAEQQRQLTHIVQGALLAAALVLGCVAWAWVVPVTPSIRAGTEIFENTAHVLAGVAALGLLGVALWLQRRK